MAEHENNSRFQLGDVYLLQFRKGIRFFTKSNSEQVVDGSCELQITVRETSEASVYFSIDTLGLVGGNVPFGGRGNSGNYSALSLDGRLSLERISVSNGAEEWSLSAEMQVDLVYRLIEEEKGFESIDGDLFTSETEQFQGGLTGIAQTRETEGLPAYFEILDGDFVIEYREGGLGEIAAVVLPLATESFTRLYGQAEESLPGPSLFENMEDSSPFIAHTALHATPMAATSNVLAVKPRRLKVRPVGFRATHTDKHTGETDYVVRSFEAAKKIWRKACVGIVVLDWHIIDDAALTQTDDYQQIAMSYVDPDPKVVEIFFVNRVQQLLQAFTGGTTFQGNHALARIVIIGEDPGTQGFPSNDNLLAHELGHVLSGRHPGTHKTGWWTADPGTILEDGLVSWPQPERNTKNNCQNARNPSLQTIPNQNCIMQPDA